MIQITLNGESRRIMPGTTMEALLNQLALPQGRVACEVNREIVRRSELGKFHLNEGDVVEIVQMIGGG